MPDILNHWWVNLGYRETPSGQVYPLPEDCKPVTLRAPTSLSSDSEGENDHTKLVQPLKGILKKPKVSSGDEESVAKQPLQTIALDNQVFDGHDSDKRDTDKHDKKPRSILKRKGKFSGGDSGCVLNETGPKSPSSDTKENAEMTYNLSDIDNALSALEMEGSSIKRNAPHHHHPLGVVDHHRHLLRYSHHLHHPAGGPHHHHPAADHHHPQEVSDQHF